MDASWLDTIRLARRRYRFAGQLGLWPPGTQTHELGTADVRVRIVGSSGPSIVLVPDPPNVIEHYQALIELLASDYRVICFEAPGFGFSIPKRGFGFGLEDQVAVARELLGKLAMGPYVLAFPCVAAYGALRLAAEQPELVERLILIQAPCWLEELSWARRIDQRGLVSKPVVGQLMLAHGQRRVARSWYQAALPKGHPSEAFLGPCLEAFDRGAFYCLASAFQATFGRPTEFAPVSQPTSIIWGIADRTHAASNGHSMEQHAPAAEIVEFRGAGHFPELEQPERFAALVRDVV